MYEIKRGDTTPPVESFLEDEHGAAPLGGATIEFFMKQVDGEKAVAGVAEAIDVADSAAAPNVRYVWRQDGTDTDTAGVYRAEWKVTFAAGTPGERVETFPSGGWEDVLIRDDLG